MRVDYNELLAAKYLRPLVQEAFPGAEVTLYQAMPSGVWTMHLKHEGLEVDVPLVAADEPLVVWSMGQVSKGLKDRLANLKWLGF